MWKKFREWFEITKAEYRGIMVLFTLIMMLWAINFYLKYFLKHNTINDIKNTVNVLYYDSTISHEKYAEKLNYKYIGYFNINEISFEELIHSGLREKTAKAIINYRNKGGKFFKPEEVYRIFNIDSSWVAFQLPYMVINEEKTDKSYKKSEELFLFNPNEVDSIELIRLGFKPWQVSNLLRYRHRGGKFYKKEDMKRLYGIDTSFYRKIAPYIDLPEAFRWDSTESAKGRVNRIHLNSSDSSDLIVLPGIGPVLAGRIIRYRNALGGFINAEQLLEVYGIDSLKWEILLPYIEVDTALIRKININNADESVLASHPYIRKGLAREIVAFRKNFRLFKSVTEIDKLSLAKDKDLKKLYPYLSAGEN